MSKVTDFITASTSKDAYADMSKYRGRDIENRFSHWFEAVKDCGLRVPKSLVFKVPTEIAMATADCSVEDIANIKTWLDKIVMPALKAEKLEHRQLFVKNAVFSNKFDANGNCITNAQGLLSAMININQAAMCCIMGYDGTDELVIREYIRHNMNKTACIYNGLPFRTEYRVFYDFDKHEPIFVANYWDRDYVRPHLYDMTDQLVYDGVYPDIKADFEANKDRVMAMVAKAMSGVTGLTGPWSIDIMSSQSPLSEQKDDDFYLIDMAVAEQSAYWDYRPGCERPDASTKAHAEKASLIALTGHE